MPILAMLLVAVMSSCSTDMNSSELVVANSKYETTSMTAAKQSAATQSKISKLKAVNLGNAGNFVILSKTGITDVYKSAVTGDVGASPITDAAILLKCDEVTGTIYTVDAAGPLPSRVTDASKLTTAVDDMQNAYTDAAGRSKPYYLNLGAGTIGAKTLTPGLYT
jgi:hypothetical protein